MKFSTKVFFSLSLVFLSVKDEEEQNFELDIYTEHFSSKRNSLWRVFSLVCCFFISNYLIFLNCLTRQFWLVYSLQFPLKQREHRGGWFVSRLEMGTVYIMEFKMEIFPSPQTIVVETWKSLVCRCKSQADISE